MTNSEQNVSVDIELMFYWGEQTSDLLGAVESTGTRVGDFSIYLLFLGR